LIKNWGIKIRLAPFFCLFLPVLLDDLLVKMHLYIATLTAYFRQVLCPIFWTGNAVQQCGHVVTFS
jgi:hypothetical protein